MGNRLLVFLMLLPLLGGVFADNAGSAATDIPLEQLLQKFPATDAVTQTLLCNAVLEHGAEGLQFLCNRLAAAEPEKVESAHYALDGLMHHVIGGRNDQQSRLFFDGIAQALSSGVPTGEKAFLMSLLQNGGSRGVNALIPFLQDEKLCDPAARALTTIGGERAGKALLSALPKASAPNKMFIIQALGNLRFKSAGPALASFAGNSSLEGIVLAALANLPYLPAETLLRDAAKRDVQYVDEYLLFARRLADEGQSEKSATICRALLADQNLYSATHIAALTVLTDNLGPRAADDLLAFIDRADKKGRISALELAGGLRDPFINKQLLSRLSAAPPEQQCEIMTVLGRQKEPEAIAAIEALLAGPDDDVRLAAAGALWKIHGDKALPRIIDLYKADLSDDTLQSLEKLLLTVPQERLYPVIMDRMAELPPVSRIPLIRILQQRHSTSAVPFLISQLNESNDECVVAALKALESLGDAGQIDAVFTNFLQSDDSDVKKAAQNALVAVTQRMTDKRPMTRKLERIWNESPPEVRLKVLPLLGRLGDDASLQLVQSATTLPALKEAALRTLIDWSDMNALDPLVALAESKEPQNFKILAIRSALRLLRENPVGEPRALGFYQRLLAAAERIEEKQQILAALASVKSPQALRLAAAYLDDPDFNYDAAFAVTKIATVDPKAKQGLPSEQVAATLIRSRAHPALLKKLNENPLVKDTLNQPPEGFVALFNGVDLTGWKGLVADPIQRAKMSAQNLASAQAKADQVMREHWRVVDGVLVFDGKGTSLCTQKDYGNFELRVDWKIEPFGDSGLYLRGTPQVQIWDPAQWPEGSGGLYNNQKNPSKPSAVADKPIGEWNTFHIIMRGEKVTVYLNDVLVVDHVTLENYWERDKPIYPSGQIELQAHNSPLYFRNIFIRELPDEQPLFSGDLFNGVDMTGWQVIGNVPESWQVENGVLYTEGVGGGWLATVQEFCNFELALEFRLPPGGNSGVFLRAPREGNPAYQGMEIQVLDDAAQEYRNLKPWQYTGSIYGLVAPSRRVTLPANQWQTMRIVCQGPQVQVQVNGQQVVDANLIDFMDQEAAHPGIKRRRGFIGLQNHSTRIEYRNIRLTELP